MLDHRLRIDVVGLKECNPAATGTCTWAPSGAGRSTLAQPPMQAALAAAIAVGRPLSTSGGLDAPGVVPAAAQPLPMRESTADRYLCRYPCSVYWQLARLVQIHKCNHHPSVTPRLQLEPMPLDWVMLTQHQVPPTGTHVCACRGFHNSPSPIQGLQLCKPTQICPFCLRLNQPWWCDIRHAHLTHRI